MTHLRDIIYLHHEQKHVGFVIFKAVDTKSATRLAVRNIVISAFKRATRRVLTFEKHYFVLLNFRVLAKIHYTLHTHYTLLLYVITQQH